MTKSMVDIWSRLNQMDEKLDHVRGDVNVLATLNRYKDRESLVKLCRSQMNGLQQQAVWYACRKELTLEELSVIMGKSTNHVAAVVSKLNKRGMLSKNEPGNKLTYLRAPITEGLGLEKWIEQNHKAKDAPLPSI